MIGPDQKIGVIANADLSPRLRADDQITLVCLSELGLPAKDPRLRKERGRCVIQRRSAQVRERALKISLGSRGRC